MFKLNPQQFAQVYDSLRADGRRAGSEKRVATRMDVQATIHLATILDRTVGRHYSALTRDISAAGIGFLQHGVADSGSKLLLRFPADKSDLFIIANVRFCRMLADGLFDIGAEFESIAEAQIVNAFLQANSADVDRIRKSILK